MYLEFTATLAKRWDELERAGILMMGGCAIASLLRMRRQISIYQAKFSLEVWRHPNEKPQQSLSAIAGLFFQLQNYSTLSKLTIG
jgi:hypothetical protein